MNARKFASGFFIMLSAILFGWGAFAIAAPAAGTDGLGKAPNFDPMTYEEARRYIENARKILRENGRKKDGYYSDSKYVRMAGDTAWKGVLKAVTVWLASKGIDWEKKNRPDVDWYASSISKINRKLHTHFVSAYHILHRSMGYDGVLDAAISSRGLEHADAIIALCEKDT